MRTAFSLCAGVALIAAAECAAPAQSNDPAPVGPVIVDPADLPPDQGPFLREEEETYASGCRIRVADAVRVVALGAYEGGVDLPISFEGDSHEVGLIAVAAARRGPRVLLVLSAYDPVVWDLRGVPAGRLAGVLVFGYHHQGVRGLPPGVPVRMSTYKGPSNGCGEPAYAYEGGPNLDRLDTRIRSIVGRGIDRFRGGYDPSGFHVDDRPVPSAADLPRGPAGIRASAPVRRDAVAPKEAGIAQLLAAGALRPATRADYEALSAALTRASPTGHLARVDPPHLGRDAYVVLRPVTLPRGMYGAHSATFLVPRGVPAPIDPGSHNTFYRLDTGLCRGAVCGR